MSVFKVVNVIMEQRDGYDEQYLLSVVNDILECSYDAEDYVENVDDVINIENKFMDHQRSLGVYIRHIDIEFVWDD